MPITLLTNVVRDTVKGVTTSIDEVLDALGSVETDARAFATDTRKAGTDFVVSTKDVALDVAATSRDKVQGFASDSRDDSAKYLSEVRDDVLDLATDARRTAIGSASDLRTSVSSSVHDGLEGVRKGADRLREAGATKTTKK